MDTLATSLLATAAKCGIWRHLDSRRRDWAYKQNGSLVDIKGAYTELIISSVQLTSCTVPNQQQVRHASAAHSSWHPHWLWGKHRNSHGATPARVGLRPGKPCLPFGVRGKWGIWTSCVTLSFSFLSEWAPQKYEQVRDDSFRVSYLTVPGLAQHICRDVQSSVGWESPTTPDTTEHSESYLCYWTAAFTAADLFLRWHIFSFALFLQFKNTNLNFGKFSVKSKTDCCCKKQDARLVSLGTFQIFIFCLLKSTSVVRYSFIFLSAARNTRRPRVESRGKINAQISFNHTYTMIGWICFYLTACIPNSIYRLMHIYFYIG